MTLSALKPVTLRIVAAIGLHPMKPQVIALVADLGGDRGAGSTYYYNIGSQGSGYSPTDSLGPSAEAVAQLVRNWNPTDILNVGDQSYTAGSSTLVDTAIGRHFNDYMHPYPSPYYLQGDYLKIGGNAVKEGQKKWPYNLYNFPNGFPNPKTGGKGGSPDKRNRYWGTLGDHDYGLKIGFAQVGVTPYNVDTSSIGTPVAPSSKGAPAATIEYAMPWLLNPALLGNDAPRVHIGNVDTTGNSGTYYSVTFGQDRLGKPLLEVFNLDTERLDINAGFEDWNTSEMNTPNENGEWLPTIEADPSYSITYDPSNPSHTPLSGTTTDIDNAYRQFTWLKKSLLQSKAKWKVVTGHHPVYTTGPWAEQQPADHMSLPYMQKILNALPKRSFDAFYNGHDHYYERVLEQNNQGIGQGIPFITNGNSGRILYAKAQVPYGGSVYEPISPGTSNTAVLSELLPSDPASVASSGLGEEGGATTAGISPGMYGYGFGATRSEFNKRFLLFHYQQAPLIDPAIANHLEGGIDPEPGFAGTTPADWIPNPTGDFDGLEDLAYFGIEVTNGVVTDVQIVNGGSGYMSSKEGGNHIVRGFNIYGNNTDLMQPWLNTAQVDLSFQAGVLTDIDLVDGGSGYELAAGAALDSNTADSISFQPDPNNEWVSLRIPLNYRLNESTYLIRDNHNEDYQDWYLITDTKAKVAMQGIPGGAGQLQIKVNPSSQKAKDIIANYDPTTGYSGSGAQQAYRKAMNGTVKVYQSDTKLGKARLVDGIATLDVDRLPNDGTVVRVEFSGDPITSYQVNYRASSSKARIKAIRPQSSRHHEYTETPGLLSPMISNESLPSSGVFVPNESNVLASAADHPYGP